MKMYRIKELNTNKFFNGFKIKKGKWYPSYTRDGTYFTTYELNYYTNLAVVYSINDFFDKIKVIAYNLETVDAGSMSAEKLRVKHEQALIMKRLKA